MQASTARLVLLCFLLLLFSAALPAQPAAQAVSAPDIVPHLVKFSGTANVIPSATVVGITIAIYKDQEGGSPLWMETQNVSLDSTGHYEIMMGATKPYGLPMELFASGEARWVGVTLNGEKEQPRVLLLSVPYALKAADAETVGGLPPSAFVLAAPPVAASASANTGAATQSAQVPPPAAVTGTGTTNYIPLWTSTSALGSSVLFQSGTGTTAKVGIGTITPAATLDIKGTETVRGSLSLPSISNATASAGSNSQPLNVVGSSYNSSSKAAVNQTFRWQVEPAANDTASPSGTWNLLYGAGSAAPAETGLKIGSNGQIAFAKGQTFPGTGAGTVTSVGLAAPSSDFTVSGSPVTNSGTLNFAWNVAPTNFATANAIVKRDSSGSFYANFIEAVSMNIENTATPSTIIGVNSVSGGTAVTGYASAAATGAIGVLGETNGSYGVEGYALETSGNGTGTFGMTNSSTGSGVNGVQVAASTTGSSKAYSAGVWGDSSSGEGLLGTADDSNALVAANNSPGGFTTAYFQNATNDSAAYVLYAIGSDYGGVCSVNVQGNLNCTGTVSATVPLDGGKRTVGMPAIQSPKNWFEDAGSGELVNGAAVVSLDSDFVQTVNTGQEYQVFLTPYGDCKGLYVTNRATNSFEVHELGGGAASIAFGYRIMALRKNYESLRFPDHTHDPVSLKPLNKGMKPAQKRPQAALARPLTLAR